MAMKLDSAEITFNYVREDGSPCEIKARITKDYGRQQWGASLTELWHNVELVDAIEEAVQQSGYLEGEPEEEEIEQD